MKKSLLFKTLFLVAFLLGNVTFSQDSDGDGIPDATDVDDDNDGILDTYECSAAINFNNASLLTATNLYDVEEGEKVIYSNALLFQNQYYDIILTIIDINGAFTVNCNNELRVNSFNSSVDEYVTYSFDLVEAGSATPSEPEGIPAILYGIILELRDIDTRNGYNFTEIAGFNPSTVTSTVTPYLSATTNLEQAGFVNGPDPAGFTLYRLDPTIVAPNDDWVGEPDDGGISGDDPDFYLYMEFDIFSHVDLLYGATGTYSTSLRLTNFGASSKCNIDNDDYLDTVDIDSDNDGIPDNVEAQTTLGYIPPSYSYGPTGLDTAYGTGIIPVDTDGDKLKDYLDSDTDNDGKPDIEENGQADTLTGVDVDSDGLDDNLDDFLTVADINDEVVTGDITDLTNSFGDVDSDATIGGDLDYRDLFDINPPPIASIDFDGVDDYLSRASFINGLGNVTVMAWVKTDSGNSTDMVIAGEDSGFRLWLQNGNKPMFTVKAAGEAEAVISCACTAINFDEWHHITGVYSSTGDMTLYVDGALAGTTNVGSPSAVIENTEYSNGNFEIGRLSTEDVVDHQYFKGDIDEVRVFDVALTEDQIQQMVYQEIEENAGNVKGAIVEKDIEDLTTSAHVDWDNLIAYYPMTDIRMGRTTDYSGYDKELYINYITTIQAQTAPMPYVAVNPTSWTTESTWEHGNVWDIEDTASNKEWSIVKISSDVSACHTIKLASLIIDSGQSLRVHSNQLVENSWYLELNGTLDLEDDSQLIQTINSDLVTSADGKILRRQEGESNPFRYNYWSSPVGGTGATSLTDNNDPLTNNTNNTPFTVGMIKDDSGSTCSFTTGYTGSGSISTYWLYTFNGVTYWDWAKISTSTPLSPGIGYTQKGTGTSDPEQQYIFEGKPNNGTILIDVEDTGGAGSVPSVSKTEYLLGNPYPSALDVWKFIDDNTGILKGDLQLWQQWGGDSHNLSEYHGGYAQLNKTGSCRAYQFVGFYGANNGNQDGTKTPTKYLPVGQGFMAEVVATGQVEFNNNQRVFIKEDDANGSYETGSTFFKSSKTKKGETAKADASKESNTEAVMQKIRLEFNSVSGPETRRELLLGFSDYTTDDFDYGFDAECVESNNNDLNLNFEGKNMNIQAYSPIAADKVVPLNFKSSGDNTFEIKITDLVGIAEDQEIFIKDNLTGDYFDLRQDAAYSFSSDQGKFNTRFEIVFQSEQQALGIEESIVKENYMYYQNKTNTLFVKKLNSEVRKLSLVNMRGQISLEMDDVPMAALQNGMKFFNMSSGAYIVHLRTSNNEVLTKKIIVN